jgi:hypothetical protein
MGSDLGTVFGPFLDLIEVAVVRDQRIVGLFSGLVCAHSGWIVLWRQIRHVDFSTLRFGGKALRDAAQALSLQAGDQGRRDETSDPTPQEESRLLDIMEWLLARIARDSRNPKSLRSLAVSFGRTPGTLFARNADSYS